MLSSALNLIATRRKSCVNARRRTAHRAESTRCAGLSPERGGSPSSPGGGGIPHPVLMGGGAALSPFSLDHTDFPGGTLSPLGRMRAVKIYQRL